jgi:tRNA(Arg) A34 adenosine deaminase TadA
MGRKRNLEPLNRDEYWMGLAFMTAAGSRSHRPQGAVVAGPTLADLVALDHDGPPKGMPDSEHVVHAEINTLFNCQSVPHGSTLYITHTPCYGCIMAALAAGIKRIVYFKTKTLDPNCVDAIRVGYAQVEGFRGNLNWMRDHIKTLMTEDIFA